MYSPKQYYLFIYFKILQACIMVYNQYCNNLIKCQPETTKRAVSCFSRLLNLVDEQLSISVAILNTILIYIQLLSRIRGVVANYLASQARDPGIDSHQHLKDSWHIWRHLRNDTVFSCNLRCLLIFLHGRSRTYRVASLRAGPVGRISYNLYFDCKHVRYVTCDFNKRIYFFKYIHAQYQ